MASSPRIPFNLSLPAHHTPYDKETTVKNIDSWLTTSLSFPDSGRPPPASTLVKGSTILLPEPLSEQFINLESDVEVFDNDAELETEDEFFDPEDDSFSEDEYMSAKADTMSQASSMRSSLRSRGNSSSRTPRHQRFTISSPSFRPGQNEESRILIRRHSEMDQPKLIERASHGYQEGLLIGFGSFILDRQTVPKLPEGSKQPEPSLLLARKSPEAGQPANLSAAADSADDDESSGLISGNPPRPQEMSLGSNSNLRNSNENFNVSASEEELGVCGTKGDRILSILMPCLCAKSVAN